MTKNKRLATSLVLLAVGWAGLYYSARGVFGRAECPRVIKLN